MGRYFKVAPQKPTQDFDRRNKVEYVKNSREISKLYQKNDCLKLKNR